MRSWYKVTDEDDAKEKMAKAKHPSSMGRERNESWSIHLRANGRCGSLASHGVNVCTLLAHTPDTRHQQQEIGGAQDGLVYAEWDW